jgi:site-specific DNA-methyltransferase (adenine-specific)
MKVTLKLGDCTVRMDGLPAGSIGAIVSDPPYEIGFMSKSWDNRGIAFSQDFWSRAFRVLKPGGIVKAFGGTRTFHRMAAAMEVAGFADVRLEAWGYGSGFPKSLNVSKAIDKMKGAVRVPKRIPHSGEAMMRHGGENTRPWIEAAIKNGYHEAPGDTPATEEAAAWDGWGTALKPAWEPVLVGRKPA